MLLTATCCRRRVDESTQRRAGIVRCHGADGQHVVIIVSAAEQERGQ
jgi:hypothetical protein